MSNRRRRILQVGATSLFGIPLIGAGLISLNDGVQSLFLSAGADGANNYFCAAFDEKGKLHFRLPVDARAHGATQCTTGSKAVLFSRSPDNKAYLIDLESSRIVSVVESKPGRHFFGHGVYSNDGNILFATENDYEKGRGVISVRDGHSLELLNEFSAHGVGPHELKMMPDGQTLVVAIGGILTHPDQPREKLNIEGMLPSLNYIDSRNGDLLGQYRVSNHQLSIRHLDVSPDNTVAISMQYQGPTERTPALVGFHHGGNAIKVARADEELYRSLNHYTGAVCIAAKSNVAAVSCPRGGQVTFWDTVNAEFISTLPIRDSGGIALSKDQSQFIIGSGSGTIYRVGTHSLKILDHIRVAHARWDNHMITLA